MSAALERNTVTPGGFPGKADETVNNNNKESFSADSRYFYDPQKLKEVKEKKAWMEDPKYFQKVAISPSAIIKIMMHCDSGVKKGIEKGGNPIEVMGMLLGRPDPDTPKTLVVTDAFPLPIEGFETRVVADDQAVVNHMIQLGECLEATRNEKFMGWYHSHPFDLGESSHCFLSQTDLSTQLQWQRAEDPYGNPFVAIVVDPLRSLQNKLPELKAFRAYPPEYNSAIANECPDATVEHSEQRRLELWGSCWSRYYELQTEFFMSTYARRVLRQLTEDYIWVRTLTESNSVEQSKATADSVAKATKQIKAASMSGVGSLRVVPGKEPGAPAPAASNGVGVEEAVGLVMEVASDERKRASLGEVKSGVFSRKTLS